jgi:hypothetical protein
MCIPPASETTVFPASRAPSAPPPFTVGQLRRAIPPHCFERSVLRSSAYLILDLVAAAVLYYASTFIDLAPTWLAWGLLWPAYWWAAAGNQGPLGGVGCENVTRAATPPFAQGNKAGPKPAFQIS